MDNATEEADGAEAREEDAKGRGKVKEEWTRRQESERRNEDGDGGEGKRPSLLQHVVLSDSMPSWLPGSARPQQPNARKTLDTHPPHV